jgi:hypothetical protein
MKHAYDPKEDLFIMEMDEGDLRIFRGWLKVHHDGLQDRLKHEEAQFNQETAETCARVQRLGNTIDLMLEERANFIEMNK